MTLQDFGSIGSFVAAIATLATLIYLAKSGRTAKRSSLRRHNPYSRA